MKTRRCARPRRRDRILWNAQRVRLAAVAAGAIEPRYPHEFLYVWTLRLNGRANPAAFVLPGLLFEAARAELGIAANRCVETPPPNPAIMAGEQPEARPCPPTPPRPPDSPC